ncbi:MAG: N-acetylmannosamine-6-phosphate 2-epimerase, partial [Atopobium sp.]|nr:N-acetylmannosamine-6-phosphate 2-epimerase [Atopobium sp.]
MAYSELVESLKGKLIVSVQAYPGEPMRHPETIAQIARA